MAKEKKKKAVSREENDAESHAKFSDEKMCKSKWKRKSKRKRGEGGDGERCGTGALDISHE